MTLFGLYFFRTRSQGVTALVSESDTNPNNKSDDETSRLVYAQDLIFAREGIVNLFYSSKGPVGHNILWKNRQNRSF